MKGSSRLDFFFAEAGRFPAQRVMNNFPGTRGDVIPGQGIRDRKSQGKGSQAGAKTGMETEGS